MDSLSDDTLLFILQLLDYKTRSRASAVCRQWRLFVSTLRSSDVAVLNLFQSPVWADEISDSLKSRFGKCAIVDNFDQLKDVLRSVCCCDVLKLWFSSDAFVALVLRAAKDCDFSIANLDLYPYSETVPLELLSEHGQSLSALAVRPHGKTMFWKGIQLGDEMVFPSTQTLALENICIGANLPFPANLSEFEWKAPRDNPSQLKSVLQNLVRGCQSLKYLSIAHYDFREQPANFAMLLDELQKMEKIVLVGFKFCKFADKAGAEYLSKIAESVEFESNESDPQATHARTWTSFESQKKRTGPTLPTLKGLRFDLCYGDVDDAMATFLTLCIHLKVLCYECMLMQSGLLSVYKIISLLQKRRIFLKFSILEQHNTSGDSKSKEVFGRDADVSAESIKPSLQMQDVLSRLDLSFMEDTLLIQTLLGSGCASNAFYPHLSEVRFIRSIGVNDAIIETISTSCPTLSHLFLNGCTLVSEKGVLCFVRNWNSWRAKNLKVIVCGTDVKLGFPVSLGLAVDNAIAEFYCSVANPCECTRGPVDSEDTLKSCNAEDRQQIASSEAALVDDLNRCNLCTTTTHSQLLRWRWNQKRFLDDEKASHKLQIWEPSSARVLLVQDYTINDLNCITGFVVSANTRE